MKLDLEDGRMLSLPEEMSDEAARTFKRALLAAEQNASPAVRDLIDATVSAFAAARAAEQERTGTGEDRIVNELRRVREAVLAPREMYPDELGELTRSRTLLPATKEGEANDD